MKILQINTTVNTGSTGRIAEEIGMVAKKSDHESFIAYGRGLRPSQSHLIRIGNKRDIILHGILTAVFDRHGFGSKGATKKLIREIDNIRPDAIGLHNLHGFYINTEILFDYLSAKSIPVVWTLFDVWSFTGHCSYFDDINCERWVSGCFSCPKKNRYPSSYFLDNSRKNYSKKKSIFNSHSNLSIVVHSKWLASIVSRSFLGGHALHVIPTGVDLDVFQPVNSDIREKYALGKKRVILGCASIWDKRKGLDDFIKLSNLLTPDEIIALVGLTQSQMVSLPSNVVGIPRTESLTELAALYSTADVFINPTWQDNFPTTNLESLACGTPVITYNTGGSPEAIDEKTGFVVEKGNIGDLYEKIQIVLRHGKEIYRDACRARSVENFNKDDRYSEYLALYESLASSKE